MPELDWTGEFGGMLAAAFAMGVSFTAGVFYRVVYMPMSKAIAEGRKDYKDLTERLIEVVSKHD